MAGIDIVLHQVMPGMELPKDPTITVNGKTVNIPSFLVKVDDVIAIKENKKELPMFKELKDVKVVMPKWLEFNSEKLTGKINALPQRDDIDLNIREHLIVELYSK